MCQINENEITSTKDFQDEIYNYPIELLIAITEHLLNYQETQYKMPDAIQAFFNRKIKGQQTTSRCYKTI